MIYKYPDEIEDFVREWSPKMRDQELAAKVNETFGTDFTPGRMKAYRGNHGIRNYKKQLSKEEYWKYQTKYPEGMYEYIRDNSRGVSSKEMAERVKELFGYEMTPTCMKQFRQRHGIKSGVTGWYQKGHPPGTKGKTIEEINKLLDCLDKLQEGGSLEQAEKMRRAMEAFLSQSLEAIRQG